MKIIRNNHGTRLQYAHQTGEGVMLDSKGVRHNIDKTELCEKYRKRAGSNDSVIFAMYLNENQEIIQIDKINLNR
jgi:hypothetical protein